MKKSYQDRPGALEICICFICQTYTLPSDMPQIDQASVLFNTCADGVPPSCLLRRTLKPGREGDIGMRGLPSLVPFRQSHELRFHGLCLTFSSGPQAQSCHRKLRTDREWTYHQKEKLDAKKTGMSMPAATSAFLAEQGMGGNLNMMLSPQICKVGCPPKHLGSRCNGQHLWAKQAFGCAWHQ